MKFHVIIFLIITVLAGCSGGFAPPEGKTVFRYNEAAGITSLDPAFARDQANMWACNLLFNGLVQLDDNLNVKPAIAESWSVDESGRIYIFKIRNDVFFHNWEGFHSQNGRRVIADDVVFSLKRVLNRETLSPGAVWLSEVLLSDSSGFAIRAIGTDTVVMVLQKPFSAFLSRLSMPYFSVIPHEAVAFYGVDFGRNPVGTGPFRFSMIKEGVKLVVLKNENYFEFDGQNRLPYLDAVSVSFIIDKQTAFLEFIKGNLDFLSGIDASYKDELLQSDGSLNPKYDSRLYMLSKPYLNTEYLGFMMDSSLLKLDSPIRLLKIRQAINLGFDRVKMMRYLRNNVGYPGVAGFIPPGMPGFIADTVNGYSYNPQKAAQLLAEAGFPNGENMPVVTISTTASYIDLAKFIHQQLGKLGIPIEIDIHQPASLRQMVANGRIPVFRGSWIADYADAENYLALFYSKNWSPSGANYTHYKNAEFDALYEKAIIESNDSIRQSIYFRLDKMVTAQAPFVVLYYDEVLRFVQKDVTGLGINSMNMLDLKRVQKSPESSM
ncbi:MAG: ABC transporter substrate-binding protein, partial [Bacteroidales bacterium]|nr:ABC transporter substrate-binding protein [Bacteroidales bacterium]